MQRNIWDIYSTVAAQQHRSTAFATSHQAKHSAANFTVTIRVATYSRVTGNTEVVPRPKSAWRKSHQRGTERRPYVHEWSSSRLVGRPEAIHLGGDDDRQFPSL